ncbi:hypothetical protein BY996DRAFT_6425898 [Phakopsora pachyrhizi]|nr:hypothetical protein BY996DRAFT_6425898 [Phakopsora pachyrhizi]
MRFGSIKKYYNKKDIEVFRNALASESDQLPKAESTSIGVGLAPSIPSTPSLSHGKIKTLKRSRDTVREGLLYSESFIGTKMLVKAYMVMKRTSKNLGTTALCLSDGATFGYQYLGVIRALLDAKHIPTVVTGTLAGSLVAAFLCFLRAGAIFDTVAWAKKTTFLTRGSLTFLEAFERTGRILNVSWSAKSSCHFGKDKG